VQKIEIVDLSLCKKQINVEVAAEKVSEQFFRVSQTIAQSANIPGFRRGRAPISVVKTRFRKEIRDEVMRNMLPNLLQSAVVDNKLMVVGEPDIDEITLNDGQPLVFKASVEVLPNFELKDYNALQVTKKVRIVTDEMIEKQLEKLREQQANLTPVEDREAKDGDFVTVDVKGKLLNEEAEDINSEGVQMQVNSPDLAPEFNENLRGMKIGDEKTFKVTYAQDDNNHDLAGKEVEYTIKLHSIKVKEIPALDDDFAQGLGDYENLEDLRKKTKESFEKAANEEAEERLKEVVLEKLLSEYDFEVPEFLVKGQTRERVENLITNLAKRGVDPRTTNLDWGQLFEGQRKVATKDVRCALLLEKIAEKENVELSETELDEEVRRISEMANLGFEATKSALTKEGAIDSIKGRLRNDKVINLVIKNAQITEEKVSSEELDAHHDHSHDHDHDHSHDHSHEHGPECDHTHDHVEATSKEESSEAQASEAKEQGQEDKKE
jgi:trigger factor